MRDIVNNERTLEEADLDAVAHLEEGHVLFIDCMNPVVYSTRCVQANFDTREFGPVQPLNMYLESNSYVLIEEEDTQISQ